MFTRLRSGIRDPGNPRRFESAESVRIPPSPISPLIRQRYPMLSQAILNGASGQIRNMGDGCRQHHAAHPVLLLLRMNPQNEQAESRIGMRCRQTVSTAFTLSWALRKLHRHAPIRHVCRARRVGMQQCTFKVRRGERAIAFNSFHCLPGNTPHVETVLRSNELITSSNWLRCRLQSDRSIAKCVIARVMPSPW